MTKIPKIRISRMRPDRATFALAALVAFGLGLVQVPSAKAQTLTVLYSCNVQVDGYLPYAPLTMDEAGNLYGTMYYGGVYDDGVVFKLASSGSETVLYSFGAYPSDGEYPYGGLIRDKAGNLYGTTTFGGESGNGTVFKLDTSGNETVLHSFAGFDSDGANPFGLLTRDQAGNLYGTTAFGGNGTCELPNFQGCGTVFKLDTSGNETVLHNFAGSPGDGAWPAGPLILDKAGNLYGTTVSGGTSSSECVECGHGTVFKLDTSGNETLLYSFTDTNGDGGSPYGMIMDEERNFYGATSIGGAFGGGTVFKLDRSGKETVLHSFAGSPGDGAGPLAAPIMDQRGNLYGTTTYGGTGTCDNQQPGCGTVYKIDPYGNETVLHNFAGSPGDGAGPFDSLVMDKAGNLYGTTFEGGAIGAITSGGTVFKLSPPTPQQATQTIIDAVNTLYSQGVLSSGEDSKLVQKLQKAIVLMNAGRQRAAAESLRDFIDDVLDLLRSGVLSQSQAEPLISAAEDVIAQLS